MMLPTTDGVGLRQRGDACSASIVRRTQGSPARHSLHLPRHQSTSLQHARAIEPAPATMRAKRVCVSRPEFYGESLIRNRDRRCEFGRTLGRTGIDPRVATPRLGSWSIRSVSRAQSGIRPNVSPRRIPSDYPDSS